MSLDQLKTQLMTIFMVKDGGNSSMLMLVGSMIAITLMDYLIKALPAIGAFFMALFANKYKKHVKLPSIAPSVTSRIVFERFYTQKCDDNITDAVLHYICKQDSAMDLVYNHFYLVNKEDVFDLTKDLKVKVIAKTFTKEGNLNSLKFELFSYTYSLSRMKKWVNRVYKEFEVEKKNKFGDKRFFFDEYVPNTHIGMPTASNLFFTMTEFQTNKSLSNTYGKHVQIVKERVKLFVDHPEWYEKKGIPYTLGLLLHGPPGTGKTSLIKAIAKDTDRHIFNIKLRDTTLPEQLNDLFYNENIKLKVGPNMNQSVVVPLSQRIYVIEDIDCLTDVVLDRKLTFETSSNSDGDEEKVTPFDDIIEYKGRKMKKIPEIPAVLNNETLTEWRDSLPTDLPPNPHNPLKPTPNPRPSNSSVGAYRTNGPYGTGGDMSKKGVDRGFSKPSSVGGYARPFADTDDKEPQGLTKEEIFGKKAVKTKEKNDEERALNLSFILNLLDGVLETPGRILIMTSNYPDRLDKALIRPGRVDINLRLGYCDDDMVKEMFEGFFGPTKLKFVGLKHRKYTPAKIQEILCNHFNDPAKAYEEINT